MSNTHSTKNQFQKRLKNYEYRINQQRQEQLQQQFHNSQQNNSFFADLFNKQNKRQAQQAGRRPDAGGAPGRLSEGESRYAAIDIEQIYRLQAMKAEELARKAQALKENPQETIKFAVKETKAPESSKSSNEDQTSIQDSDLSDFYQNAPLSIDGQLRVVARLTVCQIFSMLSFKFSVIINAFFISLAGYYHLETKENTTALIKGIGLGNIIISILCFGISQGLNGALETLVSQAYGASLNLKETERFRDEMRKLCGQYLNIARLVNTLFMIVPTAILALFADEILITFFKQDAYISELAIQYCILCMPGVWAMTQFDATKRFLSAQNHGGIPMVTQFITGGIQIFCCYIFIIEFQWGLLGAAISTDITFIMNMIICDFWIAMYSEDVYKDMWLQWARSSLDGLGQFLEFGIPSAMMECFLWCALELFVFMSGYGLGRTSQNQFSLSEREDFSAQVVIMNMFGLIYMIPQGISYSISALVGGLQAENKSNIARKYATVAYLYGQFLFIIVIIVLRMYGHQIFRRFVNNEETTARILAAMPFVFVFMLLQSSIGLLTGVIKGLGQQNMAALWTCVGYFVIGLPLASFFAFKAQSFFEWQKTPYLNEIHNLPGLYVGLIIACVILNASFLYLITSVDWTAQAKRISKDFDQYRQAHYSYYQHQQSYEHLLSRQSFQQSLSAKHDEAHGSSLRQHEHLPALPSDCLSMIETEKHTFMQSECCSVRDFTNEQKEILEQQLRAKDDEYECLFEEEADEEVLVGHQLAEAEQRRLKNLRKYL